MLQVDGACAETSLQKGTTFHGPLRRAVLKSDSHPIEVWLVTNNDPVQKPEAETAERLQLPLPPQPPEQPAQVALAGLAFVN